MCKYHHTCMCVATGKVNGSHWRIMIFIWLLSSVPPLFPRLAALWPPVLSPLPPYYFPPSTEGQRRAIRVREDEKRCKRSKRSKMTQQQWPRAASEAVAVAWFWGLWRPLKAACISRTYHHRTGCCRCYLCQKLKPPLVGFRFPNPIIFTYYGVQQIGLLKKLKWQISWVLKFFGQNFLV